MIPASQARQKIAGASTNRLFASCFVNRRAGLSCPEDVVRAYYSDISNRRFAEAAARLAPDVSTWILGYGHWPLGGRHNLNSLKKIHAIVAERFPEGLQVDIKALTVEGPRVAVEAESYGVRIDGRIYRNQYHYLLVVRDGLIKERREYMDTIQAKEMLCDPINGEHDFLS